MNTITLHSCDIVNSEKKSRRYILCLEMVQTVLHDFFPEKSTDRSLFQQLGEIAYCIDSHLDELDLEQKEILFSLFPSFYDSLGKNTSEIYFQNKLQSFSHKLGTSLYPGSWAILLYHFYNYCEKKELLPELKKFSMIVIRSGILKAKAQNADEVLKSMKDEGAASVHFLLLLLEKENLFSQEDTKFTALKKYLGRLESILNIADGIYDYKKDKRAGIIRPDLGKGFHFTLFVSLFKTLFNTIIKNNIFFFKHFFVFTGRCLRADIF